MDRSGAGSWHARPGRRRCRDRRPGAPGTGAWASSSRPSRARASPRAASTATSSRPSSMARERSSSAGSTRFSSRFTRARFDQRLGECRVGPQGEVVGIAGGLQLPGPGQGQPAIEVDPGELRPLDGAGREVAGGLEEPALRVVAVAHHEPGPERRAVEPEGPTEGVLGGVGVAVGQQGRAEQSPVVAGGRTGRATRACWSRSASVVLPQLLVEPRPLLVERGRDMVADPLGEVEPCDGPAEGLLPVRCGAATARPAGRARATRGASARRSVRDTRRCSAFVSRRNQPAAGRCLGLVRAPADRRVRGPSTAPRRGGGPTDPAVLSRNCASTKSRSNACRWNRAIRPCMPPRAATRRGAHADASARARAGAMDVALREDRDGDARTWPRARAGWARGNASSAGRRGTAAGPRPGRVRGPYRRRGSNSRHLVTRASRLQGTSGHRARSEGGRRRSSIICWIVSIGEVPGWVRGSGKGCSPASTSNRIRPIA